MIWSRYLCAYQQKMRRGRDIDPHHKKEVDLIIHQNNTVYPIEIKKSSAPRDAVKNFSVLKPITEEPSDEDRFSGAAHLKTEIGAGAVICMASGVTPIDRKNWYVPAWVV